MSALLEVRVLSGLHERARCEAADGALVGADASCDIVLADKGIAPQAARLRIGAQGWALAADDDLATGEPVTPFNQPLALGSVWITVARRTDDWLPLPEAANDPNAPGDSQPDEHRDTAAGGADGHGEPEAGSGPATGSADTRSDSDAGSDTPSTTGTAAGIRDDANTGDAPASDKQQRSTWLMLFGIVVLVLAVMAAIIVAALPSGGRSTSLADPRESTQASVGRITAVIERLGLNSRLHVAVSPDGTITVQGWVRNAAEHEKLAAALSQIWPMPAMRVTNADEAIQTAKTTLEAFSVLFLPEHEGDGRLSVNGIAASAREQAAALDALRARLPGFAVMEGDIRLASDVTRRLSDRLAEAGLSGVGLSWAPHGLNVSATGLAPDELSALRALLQDFNATHFGVAKLGQAVSLPESDSVPFIIRSVVSGPQPFIVLQDGRKLLEGGIHQGYRLKAVEADRLVFDGERPAVVLR